LGNHKILAHIQGKEKIYGYVPIQSNTIGSQDPGLFQAFNLRKEYLLPDVQDQSRLCNRKPVQVQKMPETLFLVIPHLVIQHEVAVPAILDDSLVLDDSNTC